MRDLSRSRYTARDISFAKRRCRLIAGIDGRLPELPQETDITVLIPVYNESVHRLRKQIVAFSKQDLGKKVFELVFVVNNGLPDDTQGFKRVFRANQRALAFLKKKQPCTVHVIDRSSPFHEIRACNVGKARQFGLHSVANRYLEQNRDGIVIHTDADTIPAKQGYLREVLKQVEPATCFGASGGVRYALDMDSVSRKERAFFARHIDVFRDYSEWHFLNKAMHEKNLRPMMTPFRFSGAHMVSKAIAAVCSGGIPGVAHGEDVRFGEALLAFARKRRAYLISGRQQGWVLVTALRESDRTGAAHGPTFENIKTQQGRPLARPEGAPTTFQFITQTVLPRVRDERRLKKLAAKLNEFAEDGSSSGTLAALRRLSRRIRRRMSKDEQFEAFEEWKQARVNRPTAQRINKWYAAMYPREPLTHSKVVSLRRKVFKDSRRKAYVLNALEAFGDFRLV